MQIFVGSTNPVKINAVIVAASEKWPEVTVGSFEVKSGINEQPMSDEETKQGAENRARLVLKEGLRQTKVAPKEVCLGIGLEGGVFKFEDELWSTVWAIVVDQQSNIYSSNGARFKIPAIIAQSILTGGEMGPVVSQLFGGVDVKRTNGAIGVITKNFVDRTEEYSGIIKLALGLWYGRDWESTIKRPK